MFDAGFFLVPSDFISSFLVLKTLIRKAYLDVTNVRFLTGGRSCCLRISHFAALITPRMSFFELCWALDTFIEWCWNRR